MGVEYSDPVGSGHQYKTISRFSHKDGKFRYYYWACNRCGAEYGPTEYNSIMKRRSAKCCVKYVSRERNLEKRKSLVGSVIGEQKMITEFCGIYEAPRGSSAPLYKWKCIRCDTEYGPSQLNDIKRYSGTICCTKSDKYGSLRWGYGSVTPRYMGSLHYSSMKRGLEFNVTAKYLDELLRSQGNKCAYTGIDIELGNGRASLDRIDPKLGYIEGNVQWVYGPINHMKWDLSHDEFINLCLLIAEQKGNTNGSNQ